jgi:hypothetical protein
MMARKTQTMQVPPSFSTEKASGALKKHLEALQPFKTMNYSTGWQAAKEWEHLAQSIVERSFGNPSSNLTKFAQARTTGQLWSPSMPESEKQRLFQSHVNAFESVIKSCIAELDLLLPEKELKGVYSPGEEYEFYKDTKFILSLASKEVLIIDPYLDDQMFDVYVAGITRAVSLRLLSNNVSNSVKAVAMKYAAGGNLQFRSSSAIHDRVIFADDRVWLVGESIKDAAKKKPTYIVEHDEKLQRAVYEPIWATATVIV